LFSAAVLIALLFARSMTLAQDVPLKPESLPAPAAGMGRVYVFRGIRALGAHIADYVTLNGAPVQRVSPGGGFYCDLKPGNYTIGMYRHKSTPAVVPIAAGQQQYVYIAVREQGAASPRGGAAQIDLGFDVRLLDPAYGAKRASEYTLSRSSCEPAPAAK
jgi:hypothetical protein